MVLAVCSTVPFYIIKKKHLTKFSIIKYVNVGEKFSFITELGLRVITCLIKALCNSLIMLLFWLFFIIVMLFFIIHELLLLLLKFFTGYKTCRNGSYRCASRTVAEKWTFND